MLTINGLSTLGCAVHLARACTPGFWTCCGTSLQPRAIATDWRFRGQDYAAWPALAPMWILMLSCYCANPARRGWHQCSARWCCSAGRARDAEALHPLAMTPVGSAASVVQNRSSSRSSRSACSTSGPWSGSLRPARERPRLRELFLRDHRLHHNAGPGLGVRGRLPANFQVLSDFQT